MKKEFSTFHNEYLNDYIQFADTKAAIFISINGIVLGYIFSQLIFLSIKYFFTSYSLCFFIFSYFS